jgi:hypothetical protein
MKLLRFFLSDSDEEELPKLADGVTHQEVVADHRAYLGIFIHCLRQVEIMFQQVSFLQRQERLIGVKK